LRAPWRLVGAIWELDPGALREAGVRGLILDLDNTLVDWNENYVRPEVRAWLARAREEGLQLCLVSNSIGGRRVRAMGAELGLPVVTRACKPLPVAYQRAMRVMGTTAESSCAVGDQVFTDLLGAQWLGLKTVLVRPLSKRESPHTQLIRRLEAPLRRRWARVREERGGR
jgi:HAD superfamily phosphatase (TIGR01668 family)